MSVDGDPVPGGLMAAGGSTPEALRTTGSEAWLKAMLDVERALALAAGWVGLAPPAAAAAIDKACDPARFDIADLAASLALHATPVVALVKQLRAQVPESVRPYVHLAATSQDVIDTALVLVSRRTLAPALEVVATVTDDLARLAQAHRDTPQVGRTLLQDGLITTFGAVCAARLVGVDEARRALEQVVRFRLAAQLGGAVGSLAGTAGHGVAYLEAFADVLGLPAPVTCWHTTRGRIGELAGACAVLAGELGGVAQDLILLSQNGVGEVHSASPGESSAMPGKRNPAAAVLALACARRAPGLAATLFALMPQELQRGAGTWQAEWAPVTDLLRLVAGAAHHTARALADLVVDEARMRAAVRVATAASNEPVASDGPGAAATFVDRALAAHRAQPEAWRML